MSNTAVQQSGVSIFTVIFVVLAILKLAAVKPFAAWSWWAVTAPLWGPLVAVCGILLVIAAIAAVVVILKACLR